MGLRTVLFFLGFSICAGGAVFSPVLGVAGYVAHYSIGPESQWWHAPLGGLGIRYSLTLAALTAVGMILNWGKLSRGRDLLNGQEKLMLLFLAITWMSTLFSEATQIYTVVDHPSVKLTKVMIFVFMLTHIVTTERSLDILFWAIIAGAFILGLQAYETPLSAFAAGRLETVGGPDFRDCNTLAAYLVAVLPLIGAQFLRSRWIGKMTCVTAAVFVVNAIVLTRSRGAIVGLAMGVVVGIVLGVPKHRKKLIVGLILGGLVLVQLADQGFWERAATIMRSGETRDTSAQSRLDLWQGGLRMAFDHPLGVGAGNFAQNIGQYVPEYTGRDAHNTYVRCLTELGFLGLAIFGAIILGAYITLSRLRGIIANLDTATQERFEYLDLGVLISLSVLLASGLTGTLIYVEALWWFLAFPICLLRALEDVERVVEEPQLVLSEGYWQSREST